MFWRPLRRLPPEGWRAGLVMGVFLTAGYVAQTLGLEHTTASNAGFITGLFVVLTPLFGALLFGIRPARAAWLAARRVGARAPAALGRGRRLQALGRRRSCSSARARSRSTSSSRRAPSSASTSARWSRSSSARAALFCLVVAALPATSRRPRGDGLERADRDLAGRERARLPGPELRAAHASPARTALILAAEPAFAGLFGYLLQDERLSAVAWTGALLILAAIVLVDVVPRLRPPRPLPEGNPLGRRSSAGRGP